MKTSRLACLRLLLTQCVIISLFLVCSSANSLAVSETDDLAVWSVSSYGTQVGEENRKMRQASSELARKIYEISLKSTELLEKELSGQTSIGKLTISDEQFQAVAQEFMMVLIHLSDRDAFEKLGPLNRSVFMNMLGEEINKLGTSMPMSERRPIPVFRKTVEEDIEVLGLNLDLLNKRQLEYVKYKEVLPEQNQPLRGTLLWEFGRHVKDILNESSAHLLAAYQAGEAYIAVVPLLGKIPK